MACFFGAERFPKERNGSPRSCVELLVWNAASPGMLKGTDSGGGCRAPPKGLSRGSPAHQHRQTERRRPRPSLRRRDVELDSKEPLKAPPARQPSGKPDGPRTVHGAGAAGVPADGHSIRAAGIAGCCQRTRRVHEESERHESCFGLGFADSRQASGWRPPVTASVRGTAQCRLVTGNVVAVSSSDAVHSAAAVSRSVAAALRPTSVGCPRLSWNPSGPT